MTVKEKIVSAKAGTIRRMLDGVRTLPLEDQRAFVADQVLVAAGESMLRRSLEALLDIGRHILAKGFGVPVAEYKEIGRALHSREVLDSRNSALLIEMAGYRNRLTHFYDEVTPEELQRILTTRLGDIESVLDALSTWLRDNPDIIDRSL